MSSSDLPPPLFTDPDLDDSSDEELEHHNPNPPPQQPHNLNDALDDEDDDDVIDLDTNNEDDEEFISDHPSLVTIAVPPPSLPQSTDPLLEKKIQQIQPLDDSRKLFQRLWTDEDEIELLQGFLEYMTQRGISYHNHHDLGSFYEQIKSKLQLDFNKNQLVEKLRRLKRKYRNVLNRTSVGKEVSFKSPHDQATYEISRKIWSDLSSVKDGGGDDEDVAPVSVPVSNHSPSPNYNFYNPNANVNVSPNVHYAHLNGVFDERKLSYSTKKRSRLKMEESRVVDERVLMPNLGQGVGQSSSVALGPGIQGLIEETVKSCLSPMMKEAMNSAENGLGGLRGFGGLSSGVGMLSPLGMNFGSPSGLLGGEVAERKWKKQQILELEVYSKRLELVQEQIKVTLEELRSGNRQH